MRIGPELLVEGVVQHVQATLHLAILHILVLRCFRWDTMREERLWRLVGNLRDLHLEGDFSCVGQSGPRSLGLDMRRGALRRLRLLL